MATFNEFARQYAQRIKDAIRRDGFRPNQRISSSDIARSYTLSEAKSVKQDIDNLVFTSTNQPLSEADKRKIVEQIDVELGLPKRKLNEKFVSNASNDDFSDMADEIENILRGRN
ncbi:hypothetical protein [Moritella viscosa]|uniref:hypothetical protein n=1 Tax=Moritella viscosa TaxID=80854 RepID=UPI00091B5C47|nr:hypothetical protein [Moritella viscosa]SGZ09748.1 Ribose import ATP-binding protein RbsA 3 [Moritella viscosa]